MKKLLVYLKDYKKESVLGPLFKLLEASFELIVPLVIAAIIDTGVANGDRGYVMKMWMFRLYPSPRSCVTHCLSISRRSPSRRWIQSEHPH